MSLYIDPGTGSMLFAILIGILGALRYLLRSWLVDLRFRLSGGKKVESGSEKLPLVIFADDRRYWNIFEPVCRELDRRGAEVVYMTASPEDPALKNPYPHVKAEFIGEGNRAYAKLNFLKASVVVSTTPGLDVYQWKRSRDVDCYIHMLHAASDVIAYRMFGIDYYDALMLSGEYQVQDVRDLEKLRNLPAKELVKIGIPYMDEMAERLKQSLAEDAAGKTGHSQPAPEKKPADAAFAAPEAGGADPRTVLLAPSWGKSAIFSRYGGKIIDVLLKTGYHVIVRPHPQSFISEKEMMDRLMSAYPESAQLAWNRDNDNFNVLKRSDILISDFSGVLFDFSLVYDKPVIYTDTEFDSSPYDAWWLDRELWTFRILPRIGEKLTADNMDSLKEMIDRCITDTRYAEGRDAARQETWEHPGEGAVRAADFILSKCREVTE